MRYLEEQSLEDDGFRVVSGIEGCWLAQQRISSHWHYYRTDGVAHEDFSGLRIKVFDHKSQALTFIKRQRRKAQKTQVAA